MQKNLSREFLLDEAATLQEGVVTEHGSLVVNTGQYTGRTPEAKFIVLDEQTKDAVWWGKINQAMDPRHYLALYEQVHDYLGRTTNYVQNLWVGSDPNYRLSVEITTEFAWQSLFAQNMFIRPSEEELEDFSPEWRLICVPNVKIQTWGILPDVFVVINFSKKCVLIGGTKYAGEIKKSIFTVMNYILPEKNVLPMHCSVNTNDSGNSTVFFGLSGTGKTTLSADGSRTLVGDDEHGWGHDSVFNFEGGCYAKTINLSQESEPEIFQACHKPGTILENVVFRNNMLDFSSNEFTENTRASYPLDFIPNSSLTGMAPIPKNVIFLTCDAFGVLPAVSKLDVNEAAYHFLSGYTAKVAGTERGLGSEPKAVFSACYGEPFMPRHPTVYADMLVEKVKAAKANCWLVNTGWFHGGPRKGKRFPISVTRGIINAIINNEFASVEFSRDNIFGLNVPTTGSDNVREYLCPVWHYKHQYNEIAETLMEQFRNNFANFENEVDSKIKNAGF